MIHWTGTERDARLRFQMLSVEGDVLGAERLDEPIALHASEEDETATRMIVAVHKLDFDLALFACLLDRADEVLR